MMNNIITCSNCWGCYNCLIMFSCGVFNIRNIIIRMVYSGLTPLEFFSVISNQISFFYVLLLTEGLNPWLLRNNEES